MSRLEKAAICGALIALAPLLMWGWAPWEDLLPIVLGHYGMAVVGYLFCGWARRPEVASELSTVALAAPVGLQPVPSLDQPPVHHEAPPVRSAPSDPPQQQRDRPQGRPHSGGHRSPRGAAPAPARVVVPR